MQPFNPTAVVRQDRPSPAARGPAAKRARLINTLRGIGALLPPRKLSYSANDLDEVELKKLYKVADAAVKAQNDQYEATPAVFEEFLDCVFTDWKGRKDDPLLMAIPFHHELMDIDLSTNAPVGMLPARNGRAARPVHYGLNIRDEGESHIIKGEEIPYQPDLRVVHGESGSRLHSVRTEEMYRIKWQSPNKCLEEYDNLEKRVFERLIQAFERRNARLSVTYARNWLLERAQEQGPHGEDPCLKFDVMNVWFQMAPTLVRYNHYRAPQVFGPTSAERRQGVSDSGIGEMRRWHGRMRVRYGKMESLCCRLFVGRQIARYITPDIIFLDS